MENLRDHSSTQLWRAALDSLLATNEIDETSISHWLRNLTPEGLTWVGDSPTLHVKASNPFVAELVSDRFGPKIEKALFSILGGPCKVIVVGNNSQANPNNSDSLRYTPPPPSPSTEPLQEELLPRSFLSTQHSLAAEYSSQAPSTPMSTHPVRGITLIPKYTFDSFVVGSSNQLVHATAQAVAQRPGELYNPILIYSGSGLGKTHLLHAIANEILKSRPNYRVIFLSAEDFVNDFLNALIKKNTADFRNRYRNQCDVLLVDDVQFLAQKSQTEEEFFYTFNALHSSKRQIILTSDRPPNEIRGLADRIRTRFEWGMVVQIQPPEIETRIAILRAKAEQEDIYMPDDVASYIATHVKSNVRELEAKLTYLHAQASFSGAEITFEMAKRVLNFTEEAKDVSVNDVLTAVSRAFKLRPAELKGTSRTRSIALARQIAMFLIRKYQPNLTLEEVGSLFGGRNHATVIHACQSIENAIGATPDTALIVEQIQDSF